MGTLDGSDAVVGKISSQAYSDPTSGTDFYNGSSQNVDGATGHETHFIPDFSKWNGYYNDVAIFAAAMDIMAAWVIGEGFIMDEKNEAKVRNITGFGKDDFNTILENAIRVMFICGDGMDEQIRDKAQRLTNLKPLNPGTIRIVANGSGILDRYEQGIIDDKKKFKAIGQPIATKKIFHLCWNRLADEIHGKPYAERVEPIIKQIKQLTEDLGLRFHRIVRPLRLFESETDDPTELASTETKLKQAYNNCELIVIPKKTLEEKPSNPTPSAQDAIIYLNTLLRNFVTTIGVPEVVMGWGEQTSEATSKIVTLNFETKIKRIQSYVATQIKNQLGIEGHFELTASLEPALTESQGSKNPIETPKVSSPSTDLAKRGKQITKK